MSEGLVFGNEAVAAFYILYTVHMGLAFVLTENCSRRQFLLAEVVVTFHCFARWVSLYSSDHSHFKHPHTSITHL